MNPPGGSRAERAGRAAKTSRRRRRERGRVAGWTAATLLGLPLLFAAVWLRMQVCTELKVQDDLTAVRDSLAQSVLELEWRKERLSTWESLEGRLASLHLRPPSSPKEVLWINVKGPS